MPHPKRISDLLSLRLENKSYPYGKVILDVASATPPTSYLQKEVREIAMTDSALPVGPITITVTPEAREIIDACEEKDCGFLVDGWSAVAPRFWGSQLGLGAALLETIGYEKWEQETVWDRPNGWRQDLWSHGERQLPEIVEAYKKITEAGLRPDAGTFRMRLTYMPEELWLLVKDQLPDITRGEISDLRRQVAGGVIIGWAI